MIWLRKTKGCLKKYKISEKSLKFSQIPEKLESVIDSRKKNVNRDENPEMDI